MRTDRLFASPAPTRPESCRILVLVPVGTLLKPVYDGDSESAALEAYWYAECHNQLPLFVERRRVVMV